MAELGSRRRRCLFAATVLLLAGSVASLPARNEEHDYDYDSGAGGRDSALDAGVFGDAQFVSTQRRATVGDTIRLKCKPKVDLKLPRAIDFTWFHDGQALGGAGTNANPRFKVSDNKERARLRLIDVRHEDEGLYACHWSGGDQSQGWVNYTLLVSEDIPISTMPQALHADSKVLVPDAAEEVRSLKPIFTKSLKSLVIKPAGNVAELKCQANGSDLNITWYKDGEKPTRQYGDVRIKGAMLKMENLVPTDSGSYTCVVSNEYGSINRTYKLEVIERLPTRPIINKELSNRTVVQGSEARLQCSVISDSVPYITWLKHTTRDNGVDSNGEVTNRLLIIKEGENITSTEDPQVVELTNVTEKDAGWYTCIAANSLGTSSSTAYLNVIDAEPILVDAQSNVVPILAAVFVVALAGVGLILSCFCKKWKKEKRRAKELERAKEVITQQWIKKVIVERQNSDASQEPLIVPTIKIERCQSNSHNGSENTRISEYELPLDILWELPRSKLIMGESLGEGAFGKVVKAEVQGINRPDLITTVAVKMLKEGHTDAELMDLVSEMEMMKMIGTHINIINLLGCCTQDGPLYVVVEYAAHGNLRDYLRNKRPSSGYERAIGQETNALTERDLVSFSYQVARGMEYLASKKCIHRDLAARNVLVSKDGIMKIADFGLARDIHSQDYYRKTSEGRLPVKWMAPEALFHRMYTSQSDVWAFGILLWEIMTLGGTPYPSVPSVEKLFQLLREGHRMEKPSNCSLEIYTIMRECWRYQPTQRPTFKELVEDLDRILTLSSTEDYIDFSTPQLDTPPNSCDSSHTSDVLTPR
ncbi:fibroblast growth factor receptor 3-like isoform X2 [Penaeus japonicus]|uniref:fibroblast growth factor receptor 3-like isoform X2 n=1 Tax=Penaeus japonicus TaxID=27405 RepID=UPI001C70CA3B|nr:fibroblast growth factor receptor 3-like isoform X2 [Penaeus japonicus]